MDEIVISQIRLRSEKADLNEGTRHETIRVFVKEQDRRPLEVAALGEFEPVQERRSRNAQVGRSQSAAFRGQLPERLNGCGRKVIHLDARYGCGIPRAAITPHQETIERRAPEFLIGAAAPLIIVTSIIDGRRIGWGDDFEPWFAVLVVQVHRNQDSQEIANLVGQGLQQRFGFRQSDDGAAIIASDVERPALGIGKPADPLEQLFAPRLLPFNVLGLLVRHR